MLVYTLITEHDKNNHVYLSAVINHQLFTSHHIMHETNVISSMWRYLRILFKNRFRVFRTKTVTLNTDVISQVANMKQAQKIIQYW